MTSHVLLNLLNDLRKRDKIQGLLNILSLFCNEFNEFEDKRAGMLDSIYHMILKLFKIAFWCENVKTLSNFMQHYNGYHYVRLRNL